VSAVPENIEIELDGMRLQALLGVRIIELNRIAYKRITAAPKELVIVPGVRHLFEEPGTLDEVERHAIRWFRRHLAGDEGA
jgi:hypothetical protein